MPRPVGGSKINSSLAPLIPACRLAARDQQLDQSGARIEEDAHVHRRADVAPFGSIRRGKLAPTLGVVFDADVELVTMVEVAREQVDLEGAMASGAASKALGQRALEVLQAGRVKARGEATGHFVLAGATLAEFDVREQEGFGLGEANRGLGQSTERAFGVAGMGLESACSGS